MALQKMSGELLTFEDIIPEWKVVQWSKGQWQLIGVTSPVFQGNVHLQRVGQVCSVLRKMAAMHKTWEANVIFKKRTGSYNLLDIQVDNLRRITFNEAGKNGSFACSPLCGCILQTGHLVCLMAMADKQNLKYFFVCCRVCVLGLLNVKQRCEAWFHVQGEFSTRILQFHVWMH